ncbi:MAG: sensor histidine kinase [Acidimicrobiia bacterium]
MARFVVPARLPTVILVALAVVWLVVADHVRLAASPATLGELQAIAATLAAMGGLACILRWRIDGIARNWWCGWALLVMGGCQLAMGPVHDAALGAELSAFVIGAVLLGRAIFGPEVDATIRTTTTVLVLAAGVATAALLAVVVGTGSGRLQVAWGVIGVTWVGIAVATVVRGRLRPDPERGWIIPFALALGLAELLRIALRHPGAQATADRWFELSAMALACAAALGGLVRAAVYHRTRALRERIEHERELANRQRIEESFADRLHEMRSTVVAIEGGVATLPPDLSDSTDSTLRAALIAEIRRLRTLVNETPEAKGVEAFDVTSAILPTIELMRATGLRVSFDAADARAALGRPDEIAQVVHCLLANAAKYAPGSPVRVTARHQLDEVAIRVEDDGAGIDPEFWDQIFERGFRVDPAAPTGGSGIGLSVARRLVRSQDGDLWAEAGPTGGAAFVVSIPAAPALRVVPGRADDIPGPATSGVPAEEVR